MTQESQGSLAGPQAGIIESLVLTNFMCHANLEVNLTDGVNFIIGENGSGKSAILTGLCVALGAKSRTTNRSDQGNKGLVKTGANAAKVVLRLRNVGDDAFRPEEYGPSIVIERSISAATGVSTLKLRSHSGKEVANKKSELERLADHFNIDVDNPVNVMTQDHSRAFLQSQKPRDKYKLFVKATLLGEVQDSLKFVRTNKDTMKALIEKKEGDVPALERRKKDLDDELAAFEELGKQEARKRDIVKKMGWAHVAEAEAEAAAVEAELATFRDVLIPKAAKKEAKYRGELDDAGGRRDEEQRKLDEFAASIHATAEERSAAMAAKTASQRVEARAKAKAADAKRELEDLRRRAANLSTLAHTARETQAKETQAEVGAAEKEVARCQAAAEAAKAARDAAQADDDARASAAGDARRAADAAAATVTDVAREEREAHDAVRRLTASQSNSLAMFGDRMPQLVAELRSPKGAALFSAPPVGPLGAHITLKDPRWGVAAEQAIGSMLTTFLVANTVDGKALAQLAKSFGVHDAKVIATSRLGATSVYAVRTPDGTTFPTLFSLLNAAPPCVMNALIDEASVEAILLAPSFEEAREAAEGKRGVSAAYTQEGFRHEGADGVTFMARASNKARGPPRLGRDTAAALADAKQRLSEVAAAKAKAEAAAAAAAAAARAAEAGARRGGAVAAAQAALRACLSDLHEAQRAAVAARSGGGAGAGGGLGDAEAEHLEGQLAEVIAEAEAQQAKATAEEVAAKEAAVKAAEAAKVAEEKQRTAALVQQESDALTAAFKEAAAAVRAATEKLVQYSGKKREFEDKCGEKEAELRGKRRAVDAAAAAASAVCTRDEANAVAVGAGGGAPSAEKLAALLKQADIRIEKEKGRNKRARDDVEAEADAASTELKRLKRAIGCAKEPLQRIVKCFDTRYQLLKDTSAKMRTSISNLFNNHLATRGHTGRVNVSYNEGTADLVVQLNTGSKASTTGKSKKAGSKEVSDLSALSGGERSFVTLCFTLALNSHSESPFCALDEWDVFMDAVHRKIALDKMIDYAAELHQSEDLAKQARFILITPQDITGIKSMAGVTVHRLYPARA